jgi:hypothetical protein
MLRPFPFPEWLLRVVAALLVTALVGCSSQPPAATPPPTLAGYYGCTGTNDPTLGATGFVELRADGTFDLEFAFAANASTDASVREVFVDKPGGPVRCNGRWREREANLVELETGWLLAAGDDRTLELVGPCLSITFAYVRASR